MRSPADSDPSGSGAPEARYFEDVLGADEIAPPLTRKLLNLAAAPFVLLLAGVVVLVMILWRAP